MNIDNEKLRAIESVMGQIGKQFEKGSIYKKWPYFFRE